MINYIEHEKKYAAHNYAPIPVVITKGRGAQVWDTHGKEYLDFISAYSALSHGHCHPRLLKTLQDQAGQLALTSRAYYHDKLAPFLEKLCKLAHQDRALPMNTGAEAVETAIKAARKWAYTVKGVNENKAEIIVCEGNFHGRTTTIVGFSSEAQYKSGFGPFAPGFKQVPFGNIDALEKAITENTAAFLVEPVLGEGGVVFPPDGYLKACETLCKQHNVLLICDEVQTGLGRTGKLFAHNHDNVQPDGLILGKALGGGLFPVSMFLAREDVMHVFTPGDHGSTFGGNPLASAIGLEAINVLIDENLVERSQQLGASFLAQLKAIDNPNIKEVRGKGLFIGMAFNENIDAHDICLQLLEEGILAKDTHRTIIRFAPPLIISETELNTALKAIRKILC